MNISGFGLVISILWCISLGSTVTKRHDPVSIDHYGSKITGSTTKLGIYCTNHPVSIDYYGSKITGSTKKIGFKNLTFGSEVNCGVSDSKNNLYDGSIYKLGSKALRLYKNTILFLNYLTSIIFEK